MRYGPEYKAKTRSRILRAAAQLLPQYGFEALTIDRIMAEAGLTRGAFYAYFQSKADLIAASLKDAVLDHARFASARARAASATPDAMEPPVLETDDSGWSLVLFAIEAAKSDPVVRDAFTRMLQGLADRLAKAAPADMDDPTCRAVAALALYAGGSALARAVSDPAFSNEIRKACTRAAESTLLHGC